MDRGAWWATVHGVAKNRTRLSTHTSLCLTRSGLLWERERDLFHGVSRDRMRTTWQETHGGWWGKRLAQGLEWPSCGGLSCLCELLKLQLSHPEMEGVPVFDGDRCEAGTCPLRSLLPHMACDYSTLPWVDLGKYGCNPLPRLGPPETLAMALLSCFEQKGRAIC